MLPTLRQLEYIVALADTGQFVETARQCHVSQPALSKQVKEVEDLLGVVLFERARPRVILTPAGEEIVARARRLLLDANELVSIADSLRGAHQRSIRLGVIPTIAPYGLPGLLSKLRARYPDVTYSIHERQTEVLLDQLRSGVLDVGLLARSFDDTGLDGIDLVEEPFVLVAPQGHPLATNGAVSPGQLEGESLLLMEDGHCLRDQAIEVCALAGPPPATAVAAASVSTLVRMVESGLGATLIPASALHAEVHVQQGVVARSFVKPQPGRTLTLQWRASYPNQSWFIELADLFRQHYLELNATLPKVSGPKPKILGMTAKAKSGASA